jgi:hypothetical protein
VNEEVHAPLQCLRPGKYGNLTLAKEMLDPASQVLDFLKERVNFDSFSHKPRVGPSVNLSHDIG